MIGRREAGLRAAALTAAMALTTAASAQVADCDVFRKRFAEAPRVLSLRLPNAQLFREPPNQKQNEDVWKTDAMKAEDGELWYTTSVYCRGGKLHMVVTDIDRPGGPTHPTFDLIAVDIYAVTGWDANKVVRVTDDVFSERPKGLGDIGTTELMPGVYANIDYQGFEIDFDGQ